MANNTKIIAKILQARRNDPLNVIEIEQEEIGFTDSEMEELVEVLKDLRLNVELDPYFQSHTLRIYN